MRHLALNVGLIYQKIHFWSRDWYTMYMPENRSGERIKESAVETKAKNKKEAYDPFQEKRELFKNIESALADVSAYDMECIVGEIAAHSFDDALAISDRLGYSTKKKYDVLFSTANSNRKHLPLLNKLAQYLSSNVNPVNLESHHSDVYYAITSLQQIEGDPIFIDVPKLGVRGLSVGAVELLDKVRTYYASLLKGRSVKENSKKELLGMSPAVLLAEAELSAIELNNSEYYYAAPVREAIWKAYVENFVKADFDTVDDQFGRVEGHIRNILNQPIEEQAGTLQDLANKTGRSSCAGSLTTDKSVISKADLDSWIELVNLDGNKAEKLMRTSPSCN